MYGQKIKDLTKDRLEELTERQLGRKLKPIEYNMFLFKYGDKMDVLYTKIREMLDREILKYLEEMKNDENSSI